MTTVLQDDTEVLNGISAERYGPLVEGLVSVTAAIIIAAIFRW